MQRAWVIFSLWKTQQTSFQMSSPISVNAIVMSQKRGNKSSFVSSHRHLWPIQILTMPWIQLSVEGGGEQLSPKQKWPLASCQTHRRYWTSKSGNLSQERRGERERETEGGEWGGPGGRGIGLYFRTFEPTFISIWGLPILRRSGISAVGRLASHRHLSVGAIAVSSTPWGTLPLPRRATS